MTTKSQMHEAIYDIRTVERNIGRGKLTQKEYKDYLKGLVDLTDKSAHCETELPDAHVPAKT